MSYTKLDCEFYYPDVLLLSKPASYVSINPENSPGSILVAGASAVTKNIGSQVACKLSLTHFIEGVIDFFVKENSSKSEKISQEQLAQALLESAFRRANLSVYEFGHKLSAGGRLTAELIGLFLKDNIVMTGRVGTWNAYLLRQGNVYPFFESTNNNLDESSQLLGSKSLITIETAEVPIMELDRIFVFSQTLDETQLRLFSLLAEDFGMNKSKFKPLVEDLFADSQGLPIAMVIEVGPGVVYLK